MYTYDDDDNRVVRYLEFIELEYKSGWVEYTTYVFIYVYNSYYTRIIHIIYV